MSHKHTGHTHGNRFPRGLPLRFSSIPTFQQHQTNNIRARLSIDRAHYHQEVERQLTVNVIMPSEESLEKQAEDWKIKGNSHFGKTNFDEAMSAYSQGLVLCDRILPVPTHLKATLLSNRAMCELKSMKLQDCVDDCTTAMELEPETKLRGKILFRRAKASFLLCNTSNKHSGEQNDLLQQAAKDLLTVINDEPNNKEATQLLQTIRIQHKQVVTSTSPVSKELDAIKNKHGDTSQHVKMLLGLLENDPHHAPMEFGRLNGVNILLQVATDHLNSRTAILALTCVSSAGAKPEFVREYLIPVQQRLTELVEASEDPQMVVSVLAVMLRIILHCDRDGIKEDISGKTHIHYNNLIRMLNTALEIQDKTVIRAALEVLSTWTAGKDREATIRTALGTTKDPMLPLPKSKSEQDSMSPQDYSAYKKRTYEKRLRDEAWLYERALLFLDKGLSSLLQAGAECYDHAVRREITVVVSRICAGIEDDEKVKEALKTVFQTKEQVATNKMSVVIEEIDDDDDEEGKVTNATEDEGSKYGTVTLETKMKRAIVTTALLMSKKECGAWALGSGWPTSDTDLPDLIYSENPRAMCLASEVISAAATLETAADMIKRLIDAGALEKLITNDDRDIRSGAASAVAKLGLTSRENQRDEIELMSMLKGACDLLEDRSEDETNPAKDGSKSSDKKYMHFSSFASSSVERGVEMINYLVANTSIKDELAAGYHCEIGMSHSAMDRLVEICDMPLAGESLSGFALASIFHHMAATNQTLRKEMFEGKEYTMEQFDQMQEMGKTEEEKELLQEQTTDHDTQAACDERIRKMAAANVPHALVNLIDGASEHTLEQIVMTMNRMACEQSARGILIQQGILSALIKIDKQEQPTDTDTIKKLTRLARHTMAKILITQNPTMLTSAQRLGSIKPLLQLIRDIHATDLQCFEALMAITNIAGSGEDARNRIIGENGIGPLHYCMFSDHEMVQQAATEAMCNLITHQAMLEHLKVSDHMRLWLAFAEDYEGRYECARAAAGGLAMATQDPEIAAALVALPKFGDSLDSMLGSGRLEIMHRSFVLLFNLIRHGGASKKKAEECGLIAFVKLFVEKYHQGADLDFPPQEKALLPVVLDIAKDIVRAAEDATGQ